MASDDMKKLIQLMESAPAKVADEELDEMFFYPDTRSREEKNRAANKPQDILGRRPEQAIAKHGKEYKAMKKGTSPQDAADRERYGLGGPKGKLPENAIHKIYRNGDGSATVVLESGAAYWYESDFVNEYMLNESGKVDRNMLNEAVRAGFIQGNPASTLDSGDPNDPETKMNFRRPETNAERNLLAAQIKKARAYNRSSMDYEKNTGVDQGGDPDAFANLAPLQRGVKSSQVYDYQQRSNTPPGMLGHDGYRHIGTGTTDDLVKASEKAYNTRGAGPRSDKFDSDINNTTIGVLDTNKPNRALKVRSSANDGRSGYMPAFRRPKPRPQRPDGL